MKNKIVFLGSLCLILAVGLVFVGCQDDGPQIVELDSVSAPKNVSASWVATVQDNPATPVNEYKNAHLLVTWDASDANDIGGYQVVVSQDGKKNWIAIGSGWIIDSNPAAVKGAETSAGSGLYTYTKTHTLPDIDKYTAEFQQSGSGSIGGGNGIGNFSGTFKIGVYASPRNSDNKNPSDPTWAKDLVTIPAYTYTDY